MRQRPQRRDQPRWRLHAPQRRTVRRQTRTCEPCVTAARVSERAPPPAQRRPKGRSTRRWQQLVTAFEESSRMATVRLKGQWPRSRRPPEGTSRSACQEPASMKRTVRRPPRRREAAQPPRQRSLPSSPGARGIGMPSQRCCVSKLQPSVPWMSRDYVERSERRTSCCREQVDTTRHSTNYMRPSTPPHPALTAETWRFRSRCERAASLV